MRLIFECFQTELHTMIPYFPTIKKTRCVILYSIHHNKARWYFFKNMEAEYLEQLNKSKAEFLLTVNSLFSNLENSFQDHVQTTSLFTQILHDLDTDLSEQLHDISIL